MGSEVSITHGEELFAAGHLEDALRVFDLLLERQPNNKEALNNKGVVLYQLGRDQEAAALFAELISEDNSQLDALSNLLELLWSIENWRALQTVVDEFGEILPEVDRDKYVNRCLVEKEKNAAESIKNVTVDWQHSGRDISFQLQLDLEEFSQRIIWSSLSQQRMYEEETAAFMARVIEPGDAVCDFGGHIGFFALLAAALTGSAGRVYVVEPAAANYRHLLRHVALNQTDTITAFNCLVGDRKMTGEFFINCDNDGGHALWEVGRHQFNVQSRALCLRKKIPVYPADQLLADADLSRCRLVKMDVEGAELSVMRGFQKTLRTYSIPYVISEINRFALQQMGTSEGELRCFMEGLGYDCYYFPDASGRVEKLSPRQVVQSESVFNVLFSRVQPVFLA